MIVGHLIIKKYRKYKQQGIGTRFIVFGIPLVPIQSFYYLDKKQSIEIDLYWQQAVKIYLYIFSFFFLLFKYINSDFYGSSFTQNLITILVINVIVYLFLDPYTPKDRKIRELLGRAVHINALPKFLGSEMAYKIQDGFIRSFKSHYSESWKEIVKSRAYTNDQIPLLFAIVTYEVYLYKNEKMKQDFNILFSKYKELEKLN